MFSFRGDGGGGGNHGTRGTNDRMTIYKVTRGDGPLGGDTGLWTARPDSYYRYYPPERSLSTLLLDNWARDSRDTGLCHERSRMASVGRNVVLVC